MKTGLKSPDFTAIDQDENKVKLKDYKGQWVVLYFYPKDNTSGCTIEAQDFTKQLKTFEKLNAQILGVSPDSPKSHCKFIESKKLKVRLISDGDHKVLEKYGVWQLKKNYGREYLGVARTTVLVDPQGKIAYVWEKVKVKGHVDDVKARLKELSA
ncbi:MAG: thioredoxin-dependent thiol peroxidase [Nitrospinota bacterium]